jgi:hypothetical protein
MKEQYPPSIIQFSRPFKLKYPEGSLKIQVDQSSERYLIAMDPSNAEVI